MTINLPTPTRQPATGLWPDVATARAFLGGLMMSPADPDRPPVDNLNPQQLADWAIAHEIGPLVYTRYRTASPELARLLQPDFFSATAETSIHTLALAQIKQQFLAAGIPLVLLKGAALGTSAYGNAALRPMSDIDIWVRTADMPEAARLMGAPPLGYRVQTNHERPFSLQQLVNGEIILVRPEQKWTPVELHWSPFVGWWLQHMAAIDDAAVWARLEPLAAEPGVYQLAAEDTILHLAVHMGVNHQFGMALIRSLFDIAFTAQTRPVDWEVVAQRARQWRVTTVVWTALHLLDQLIGLPAMATALEQLRPSSLRRRLLQQFITPERALAGGDPRQSRYRYFLLLILIDRPQDMLRILAHTLWPNPAWLQARYQGQKSHWRHLRHLLRHGQV